MQPTPVLTSRRSKQQSHQRSGAFRKAGAFCATLLYVFVLICSLSLRGYGEATAPYEIYLHNSQGVLVDVTSTTYYLGGYVYDAASGNVIGVASTYQKGHVYDLLGNDIGLIVQNN